MINITFFTGAGISQESGIETFRGTDGLWGKYKIEDVATIEAWNLNPSLCCEFYHERRKQIQSCEPNEAHRLIAELQRGRSDCNVNIITQNVDDLHERAGSDNVLHLHGNINEVLVDLPWGQEVYPYEDSLHAHKPNVVMFGEDVPNMIPAIDIIEETNYLIVVGTSLSVYPANSLLEYTNQCCKIYNINSDMGEVLRGVEYINNVASEGIKELLAIL